MMPHPNVAGGEMKKQRTVSYIILFLLSSTPLIAGYTTPNTGVDWTLDSLALYSGGTLTGIFPNYTLGDTLTVAQNDKLTIQPGSIVSVTQGSGKGFTVFGILKALGTGTDSIIIRGVVSSTGSHRGFRFEDSSVDSACVIAYCRIQDAVDGVYCLNSSPTISHSLFTNNSSNGVRCFGASPAVTNCMFVQNYQSAITANVNSSPRIENNIFARNNVQNTTPRNQIAIGGQGTNNPIIRNNEIYNQSYFRAGGISLVTLSGTDVCNAIIENNYIHDSSFGIVVQGLSPGGILQPLIRYNRIENNRINPDSMNSGSGIAVYTGGPTNAPVITGNIIKGNYWGVTCVSSAGLANSPRPNLGDLSNPDTTDDGWNIFVNNHNGGRIYQLYNNGTQNISAQNNYWGSSDSSVIESYITHHPDSTVFGVVNYRPYGIRGLERPETLWVERIVGPEQPTYRLRWQFVPHDSSARIRVLFGPDSLSLMQLDLLRDTATSYVYHTLFPMRHFIGLSSFNRFGESDTTVIQYEPPTGVRAIDVPGEFLLEQNYPNPFNPVTTIRFTVGSRQLVVLNVFDVLGREVAMLVNELKQPGKYSVAFDGRGLASGVYFCKLKAGRYFATTRLVLLR